MHSPLRQQLLDSAISIISQARPLVDTIARRDRELGSQLRRALSSIALNLAEGLGSAGGNARLRFESARGSLYEAHTGLRLAVAWEYVSPADCAPILIAMDHLVRRIYGLIRR
jgi:four helix bundle protein